MRRIHVRANRILACEYEGEDVLRRLNEDTECTPQKRYKKLLIEH